MWGRTTDLLYCTATLHKLAAAHLQAPERQIDYCTPMKTVAYKKFNNNTVFFQNMARALIIFKWHQIRR